MLKFFLKFFSILKPFQSLEQIEKKEETWELWIQVFGWGAFDIHILSTNLSQPSFLIHVKSLTIPVVVVAKKGVSIRSQNLEQVWPLKEDEIEIRVHILTPLPTPPARCCASLQDEKFGQQLNITRYTAGSKFYDLVTKIERLLLIIIIITHHK